MVNPFPSPIDKTHNYYIALCEDRRRSIKITEGVAETLPVAARTDTARKALDKMKEIVGAIEATALAIQDTQSLNDLGHRLTELDNAFIRYEAVVSSEFFTGLYRYCCEGCSARVPNTEIEAQLAQARKENERLIQEVERLRAERSPKTPSPMDCAACRSESTHSNDWVEDVECAVSFACALMQAGERGSTDYHEAEWKTRRGASRKRAFEAFRRALPDHLKEADPKKK